MSHVPKFCRRTPRLPKFWNLKQIISIFDERTTILNFKEEKRPSNFYGANVDTLGIFQTESVIIEYRIKNLSRFKFISRTHPENTGQHLRSLRHVNHVSSGLRGHSYVVQFLRDCYMTFNFLNLTLMTIRLKSHFSLNLILAYSQILLNFICT